MEFTKSLNNQFILKNQIKIDWNLNPLWWSRPYEYAFAYNAVDIDDTIIDAACGIEHPFKERITKVAKKVYAVDIDERINDVKIKNKKVELICGDIKNLSNYVEEKVDKIVCISVLEHIKNDLETCLVSFMKALKDDGQIILTIDYPTLTPTELLIVCEKIGLKLVGDHDYNIKENMIAEHGLNVFTAVLSK
jgi:2-polyprenyl-3-methyl-5-hydroxy-6-metoxy-1,4-benzoquinol methylase